MGFKKILLILFLLGCLAGIASATTADIGCPWTYAKQASNIYDNPTSTGDYQQLAFRWDYSQTVQINKVALYRFWTNGQGGPYNIKIVNDDNGKPGTSVYAQNLSWSEHGANRGTSWIPLNGTFTLPANTYCWVVIDGRNVISENNATGFATFDRAAIPADGSIGIDYQRWKTASWNSTNTWVSPALTGSGYPMYGDVAMYYGDTPIGDGQFAFNEATYHINGLQLDGQKITNAPNTTFKINNFKARLLAQGSYGTPYFVVLDENLNELSNRSFTPTTGTWDKQTITFDPAVEIDAGHSTIICVIKAPQGTGDTNGLQMRGIEYVAPNSVYMTARDTSYPYGNRYATGTTGLPMAGSWIGETIGMDAMLNMSITFGDESSTNDYFVSPLIGNDTYDGTTTVLPYKTLTKASTVPDGSTVWLLPGTYTDSFIPENSNVTIKPFSTNVTISGGEYGVHAYRVNNITVDGLNFTGQTGTAVFFEEGDNQTIQNCRVVDGHDAIRFVACNNTLAQSNYITNMSEHGIHVFNQYLEHVYVNNDVVSNNVSNCVHNMIDFHSEISNSRIANNDVYFTDAWAGNKNNTSVYLHNGNITNIILENNSIHGTGRPLELVNANNITMRNNHIYDGRMWGNNSINPSRILFLAKNVTHESPPEAAVQMDNYGCHNITISGNNLSDLGYTYDFTHDYSLTATFSDFLFENNTYKNTTYYNIKRETNKTLSNFTFIDEIFTNFTMSWGGNLAADGEFTFINNSYYPINSKPSGRTSGSAITQLSLDIAPGDTDVWYGQGVPLSYAGANKNGNLSIDFGDYYPFKYMTVAITSRNASVFPTTQPIAITSSSEQTDYPVKVVLPYNSSMQSDFDDVRFFDSGNTELSYWLESKTDGETATFWTKVPIVNNGETLINVTYGNQELTSESNGSTVFTFFDDFEDGSLDSKWTVGSLVTAPETGGQLVVDVNSATITDKNISGSVYAPLSLGNSFEAVASMDYTGYNTSSEGNMFFMLSETSGWKGLYGGIYDQSSSLTVSPFQAMIYETKSATGNFYPVNGTVKTVIQRNSTGYAKVLNETGIVREGAYANALTHVRLINQRYNTYTPKTEKWNYVYVRKLADTEPTYELETAIPDEESANLPLEVFSEITGDTYILLNNSTGIVPSGSVRYVNFTTQSRDWDYEIHLYADSFIPVAAFSADAIDGTAPKTIQFTDASTGADAWIWDFNNDGTPDSTDQNPSHTYVTDGNYTVKLTVSNEYGSDSETKTEYIKLTNPYVAPIILTSAFAAFLFMLARRRW